MELEQLPPQPIELFAQWFAHARQAGGDADPTAMTLATATSRGVPSARVVLLKEFDERGFVFYTNLQSRKARELQENSAAALCFYWPVSGRQVRVAGQVVQVSEEEANHYFASRPHGSQLGAWASAQSQTLSHPNALLEKYHEVEQRFAGQSVPRPAFWSGFRVMPDYLEFWQQGEHRLHTRFCYRKNSDGHWQINYLYP